MTYRHPQAVFVKPAVDAADEHFRRCCQTARALHLATMSPDRALADIGHPDKWRQDVPFMVGMIEQFDELVIAHRKALVEFALSLEGSVQSPKDYGFTDDVSDALFEARQRAEAEDA